MTPDTPRDTRMSYVYHVHFSQYLADGSVADGDATLTLSVPIQYVSDLALVKRLILELRPGRDAVVKSWHLLCGEQRPASPEPEVRVGFGGDRVAYERPTVSPSRKTLFPPLPSPMTVQEWVDHFRALPARPVWPVRADESALDAVAALRYSPELQARGERSNSCLMDGLAHLREATDHATADAKAAQLLLDLEAFTQHGLVPDAAVKYLRMIAHTLHQVRGNLAPEVSR